MSDSFPLPPSLRLLVEDLPIEALAFSPVPVKPRHDGWSAERQRAFILRLALAGSVAPAAKAVGKTRESAYRLLRHDGAESFAAAWGTALRWGRSSAADLGIERALLGERVGIFYRGRRVGERVRFDNRLIIAALTGRAEEPALPAGEAADELRRLLDEIDPVGSEKDFPDDFP